MSIGERITRLRKEKDLSQGQLATLMSVSRQAISKWENDQTSPDTLNLIRLAELLGSDIQFLATGEIQQPTSAKEPVVVTVVREVEKEVIVEKPVEVEKTVVKTVVKEVPVERIVEVETVVEKPIIRRRIRVKYRNHPVHMLLLGGGCFLIGLILGLLL